MSKWALLLWLASAACHAKDDKAMRAQIRTALFVPDELPALQAETHGRFHPAPGVVAKRISYGTLQGFRVPAILYRPARPKAKMPGLIVVNGHGGDKYSWYSAYSGILYARAGAAVLTYDPAGEGERNREGKSGTRAHDHLPHPPDFGPRLGGLMMTDLMQAVSYLSSRSDVDAGRLGALGYSMGSFVLSLACAVDTRLHACVLTGGGNLDGLGGVWDNSKPMCQALPYKALTFLGDRAAVLYALHALRGPTLVYNGRQDDTVSMTTHGPELFKDLHGRTVQLRGSSAGVFEYAFTDGAHRPYFVTKPVALWLHKHLGFPAWSSGDITNMPESHISEWAQSTGAALDPLYATEAREGGTRALGTGIPAPSRDRLHVFTPEQRRNMAGRLTYEAWLHAIR